MNLTLWRIRHLRLRCLFGFHKWMGDPSFPFCDNCPVDKVDGIIEEMWDLK